MAKKDLQSGNKEFLDKIDELQKQVDSKQSTINSLQQQLNQKTGELTVERQTTQDLSNQLGNLQREKARYFLLYNQVNQELQQLKQQSKPAK